MKTTAGFGSVDGAALVIATVVGAGIFTVPSIVAGLTGSTKLILLLWVLGGLMAMAGALSYAEMASRLPRGGAEYTYIREAFGPTAGFLSGWTSFVAGFSGAIAAAAVGFAEYLAALLPSTGSYRTTTALLLIGVFTLVSVRGIQASRVATNSLAFVIVGGVVLVASAGLFGRGAPLVAAATTGDGALSALVPIFFTYSGWNAAAYVAGDFRNPERTVPRALIGGTLVVTALYVLLNASLLHSLSHAGVAATPSPVASSASATLGNAGATATAVLVLIALASSVCAMVITGPRIYQAMAHDAVMPRWFARRSRNGVPVFSILAQSLWSGVLVLTGTFAQIVTYTGFAIVVFSGVAVLSLFVLRRRPGLPHGYRVPGYPLVPAAFVAAVAVIAVSSFRYAPAPSLLGVAMILAGLPVLWLQTRYGACARAEERAPVLDPG